jgi:hypothetical protein
MAKGGVCQEKKRQQHGTIDSCISYVLYVIPRLDRGIQEKNDRNVENAGFPLSWE